MNLLITLCFIVLSSPSFVASVGNFKVIIIGAGSAGIAAATKLLENGVDNIAILEAEDRIGGRINTIIFGGRIVELGAETCNGGEGNIVYDMVRKYNLLKEKDGSFEMLYSDGGKLDQSIVEDFYDFYYNFTTWMSGEIADTSESIGDSILKQYDLSVLEKYKEDDKKLKLAVETISTIESEVLLRTGAFTWFVPSVRSGYRGSNIEFNWKDIGYITLLKIMMRMYENNIDVLGIYEKIHYKRRVTKIEWAANEYSNVIVRCEDGNVYTADRVIFTPSLGVLKNEHRNIFRPSLPPNKIEAIEAVGFGGIMKIVVNFPIKWWFGEFVQRLLVWSAEDKANLPFKFPRGPIKDGESWITHVRRLYAEPNNPNSIAALVTGDIVPEIEETPIDVIQEGMIYILNRFLGGIYNITIPDEIIHTNWCTNKNFYGTYSFETVESVAATTNCNRVLSEPLFNHGNEPVVLFAGEATNVKHYSTVHGAIESGYREATRLLILFSHRK